MNNCLLCDAQLNEVHRIENFPTFMGTVDDTAEDFPKASLVFAICDQCHQFQVADRLSLEQLYPCNHNGDIVGQIWQDHYAAFKAFAADMGLRGRVVEIGDPSGKLAKIMHHRADSWDIIEPNPTIEPFANVRFHREFFGADSKTPPCDFIVHSHVFEHQYDPVGFLKAAKNSLPTDGKMIFTVPNMYSIAANNLCMASILNFEHTFYMDETTIRWLCAVAGLKIEKLEWFRDHSIFVCCSTGGSSPPDLLAHNIKRERMLRHNLRAGDELATYIAEKMATTKLEVFLFGAHVTSQYMLCSGVPENRISGLLDNGPSKIGKRLSGTDLRVFEPSHIAGRPVAVVTSHSGAYRKEIEKQLLEMQPNVSLL